MSRLDTAVHGIRTARLYVKDLLSHIDPDDWFRLPEGGVTHVAWQVGHLAVAEYGLAMKRVRGELPSDEELIPAEFRRSFGKGSVPEPDPDKNPSIEELREVFERVHRATVEEAKQLTDAVLDEPTGPPEHRMFNTKLGALTWCAQHEFIHAGQIALLRRLFGNEPLR